MEYGYLEYIRGYPGYTGHHRLAPQLSRSIGLVLVPPHCQRNYSFSLLNPPFFIASPFIGVSVAFGPTMDQLQFLAGAQSSHSGSCFYVWSILSRLPTFSILSQMLQLLNSFQNRTHPLRRWIGLHLHSSIMMMI